MQVLSKADAHKLHASLRPLLTEGEVLLPSETQLQELVSRAFWASLEKEEGRPTIFALCFLPPTAVRTGQPLIFEETQDLDVLNIVKLAPALLPGRRAIGVQVDRREQLEIWGMLPLPTPGLTVEAVGPGHIAVRFLGRKESTSDELAIRSVPLSSLGGARHRSAAEFCCTQKRALAFVASQDGSLTVFGWQSRSDRLFAVRRAELDSL